jgi:hypothetical protein
MPKPSAAFSRGISLTALADPYPLSNDSVRKGPAVVLRNRLGYHFQNRVRWPTVRGPDGSVAQGLRDQAQWDSEAGVWRYSNDELPLITEAPTFEQRVHRVLEIAPEPVAPSSAPARVATKSV